MQLKDHLKNYAIDAYRYYAIHGDCFSEAGATDDIIAVKQAFGEMKPICRRAVELVYFPDSRDIKNNIRIAEIEINVNRKQLHNLLNSARRLFATKRGLRIC